MTFPWQYQGNPWQFSTGDNRWHCRDGTKETCDNTVTDFMSVTVLVELHNESWEREVERTDSYCIAPDKAAYCVFTQLLRPQNAIKFIYVRTKTQYKSLILNSELFHSVWRYSVRFAIAVSAYNTRDCWVQINTQHGAKSSILNCKPVLGHSYPCLAIPNIYTITTLIRVNDNNGETWDRAIE